MKLYTKTGDDGSTGLHGGGRIEKDSPRMDAIGAVDELNSHVGIAMSVCEHDELTTLMQSIQNRLFDLGADLAGDTGRITSDHVAESESQIDNTCEPLEPMKYFILPGGSKLASRLHVARTVCRRAERACIALSRTDDVNGHVLVYLNRLSDLLFAVARRANQLAGIADIPWKP